MAKKPIAKNKVVVKSKGKSHIPTVKKPNTTANVKASVGVLVDAGAPTKFEVDFIDRAERYCGRYSFKDADLATEFEVSVDTIMRWKRKYKKFKNAIDRGKELNSASIEHNLRKIATPHDEIQITHALKGRGKKQKLVVVEKKVKQGVVDVTAALRVLAADDQRFRAKGDIDVNVNGLADFLKDLG